jgi:tRNA 2-thiouridine synthesizing protein E
MMATIDVNGTSVEVTDEGYLVDATSWSEDLAKAIAVVDGIEFTDQHMDILVYLRDEHAKGEEPNERTIIKAMKTVWGKKPTSKLMYNLFPGTPSKQGRKLAGLPKSNRKGGY